jgi:hypothetical protein
LRRHRRVGGQRARHEGEEGRTALLVDHGKAEDER